jgi:hypothetical protein
VDEAVGKKKALLEPYRLTGEIMRQSISNVPSRKDPSFATATILLSGNIICRFDSLWIESRCR